MSNLGKKETSKYEAPILVPLGALAKGSGVCITGSSVVDNGGNGGNGAACSPGAADGGVGPIDCTGGATATQDCTAGPTATRDCTAGTNALRACTGGTAALDACTAGTSN
jgi:hypothetical protein